MKKICRITGKEFEVTDEDLAFYEKIDVPLPTLCPEERERRRWTWRDKDFFLRNCNKCQKKVMAWFSPEITDIRTYCDACYRSDEFDAIEYARDFDFNRPFFDQLNELQKLVPRHISNAVQNENSDYIIAAHRNKNCYFVDELDGSWDCYFGYSIQECKNIVDGIYVRDSEIGYDLVRAEDCYSVFHSKNVFNCSNSAFLMDCRGCRHCLFSSNLRNKEYHLFNQPVSKEVFQEAWDSVFTGSRNKLELCRQKFDEFLKTQTFPASTIINCEDSTGDYLSNCKNTKDCFCIDNCRDCRFCSDIHYSKDCYDVNIYEGDLMYECTNAGPKGYGQFFSVLSWYSQNLYYCIDMHGCKDCFGCISLKKKQYCIFNKQYSKEEYELLSKKIVQHMRETAEYGEFLPTEISPLPYNQTMAQRFFPLTKEEVLARGWKWIDEKEGIVEDAESEVPENINEVGDDIVNRIFMCTKSGKKFRFTDAEIKFYKKHGIPLPTLSPVMRIDALWSKMNPRKLNKRQCSSCGEGIETTLSDDIEKIMCAGCYSGLVR